VYVYLGTLYSFVFPSSLAQSLSLRLSACHVVPGEHEKCGEDVSQIGWHRANELCLSGAHCGPRDTLSAADRGAKARCPWRWRSGRLARHVELGQGMPDADDSGSSSNSSNSTHTYGSKACVYACVVVDRVYVYVKEIGRHGITLFI
jgi:hypothetical protein